MNSFPHLEPKRGIFERLLHLAASKRTEIASTFGRTAVGKLGRQLFEGFLTGLDLRKWEMSGEQGARDEQMSDERGQWEEQGREKNNNTWRNQNKASLNHDMELFVQ